MASDRTNCHFCPTVLITWVMSDSVWKEAARGMNIRWQGPLVVILEAS